MRSILTKTQKDALRALAERGGEGAIMRNGCVLAQGEVLGDPPDTDGCYFIRSTWNKLRELGLVESAGTGRIRISVKVRDYT